MSSEPLCLDCTCCEATDTRLPIQSVRRLDVKPGDVLVIKVGDCVYQDKALQHLGAYLRELLPNDVKIVCTTSNVDFAVLAGDTQ